MSREGRRSLVVGAVCLVTFLALAILAGADRSSIPSVGQADVGRPATESVRPSGALHALVTPVRVVTDSVLAVGLEPVPFGLLALTVGWTLVAVRRSSPGPRSRAVPRWGTRGPPVLVPV